MRGACSPHPRTALLAVRPMGLRVTHLLFENPNGLGASSCIQGLERRLSAEWTDSFPTASWGNRGKKDITAIWKCFVGGEIENKAGRELQKAFHFPCPKARSVRFGQFFTEISLISFCKSYCMPCPNSATGLSPNTYLGSFYLQCQPSSSCPQGNMENGLLLFLRSVLSVRRFSTNDGKLLATLAL